MKIKVHAETKLSGYYEKIEVLRADGSLKQEFAGFSNLIVDVGLQRLGAARAGVFDYCRVGSGTATPQQTDNNLQAQVASTNSATETFATNLIDGFASTTVVYTFAQGAVVGNISELATGWADSGINTIFSRARILDGNGNPTTITILADEILRVTWTHRRYWPVTDSTGELANIGNKGGSYSWLCRAAEVNLWKAGQLSGATLRMTGKTGSPYTPGAATLWSGAGAELGSITDLPIGSRTQPFTTLEFADGTSSTQRLLFSTAQGNYVDGMSVFSFGVGNNVTYQLQFTPPIIKTANDLAEIDFIHSWGRR